MEEYEELMIDPAKMAAYREKYGYTGHDKSCLFCGESVGNFRTRHMKQFHPGAAVETEKDKTTVVKTATKLYKPTKPRLRGVRYRTTGTIIEFNSVRHEHHAQVATRGLLQKLNARGN